jgi:hypothetical protein
MAMALLAIQFYLPQGRVIMKNKLTGLVFGVLLLGTISTSSSAYAMKYECNGKIENLQVSDGNNMLVKLIGKNWRKIGDVSSPAHVLMYKSLLSAQLAGREVMIRHFDVSCDAPQNYIKTASAVRVY